MSRSGIDIITEIKSRIRELDPVELMQLLNAGGLGDEFVLVDVREVEEREQGYIAGDKHIARGSLETQIESFVPDRAQRIILYCRSGTRSALAAHTLQELFGYERVESLAGGVILWKNHGYHLQIPAVLSKEQQERYSRHLLIPEVGLAGQAKLLGAKVLLLGAGGLGSPVGLYLAAAGVGQIGIVDDDVVDLSNLQRQVLHTTDSVGMPKVESAAATIRSLNPDVEVIPYRQRLGRDNILDTISGWDVIVDGADNFPTRYLLNDASVRLRIPVVSASILGFAGQLSVFKPYEGPCYRCLYPEPPPAELAPSCAANGVLGVLPGTLGLLQATEVIKLILGEGKPLIGRLLLYDALAASFTELRVRKDPECPICAHQPDALATAELGIFPDYEVFCAG